jgi:hypothetical protein
MATDESMTDAVKARIDVRIFTGHRNLRDMCTGSGSEDRRAAL